MKKKLFTILILLIFPILAFAQEPQKTDIVFKAKILEVLKEVHKIMPDGTPTTQQNIKLKGLEGEFKDKEIIYRGVDDFDVIKKAIYKEGDTVLAIASFMNDGEVNYYIIDFVRNNNLWTLTIIFILTLLLVGGFKGGRSLLSLFITFFIFIKLAHLSGVFSEEIFYLVDIGDAHINFQGLLLAGIIIGTLGVLDDVVISQIAAVEQIYLTNKHQTKKEIFKKAYKIGISHISSMTNTLFLAYAGVSLPLLILFLSGQSAFSSFEQIVNNEQIATEIVRTLAGSIGLILSVPISTTIAVWWFKKIKSH